MAQDTNRYGLLRNHLEFSESTMTQTTTHNPDLFMADLRQILSQGRKRIGLLIGAGAPVALKVDKNGILDDNGEPLIPDVERLTKTVMETLDRSDREVVDKFELGENPNIETILTRIRRLSQAIGNAKVYGLDSADYESMAGRICKKIGSTVARPLPDGPNPYSDLVSWIGGTHRDHSIEIFTPNYDLLLEEAFERARLPYFDGFTGAYKPFFDPTGVSDDVLPPRWSRIWKIHGSLGWEEAPGGTIIRTGRRDAAMLIYPDHLKYDRIARQPFSALFARLRRFLTTPDSLLLCTGFSFSDAQITAVLDEALAVNTHTAVLAFQFRRLDQENAAVALAQRRPNLSVYARDRAMIFGVPGLWNPGKPPTEDWENIRRTFWSGGSDDSGGKFLLGDFAMLARFFMQTQATTLIRETGTPAGAPEGEQPTAPPAADEPPPENAND